MVEYSGTILITGCSGHIGTHVIQKLQGKFRMVGFDIVAPTQKFEDFDYLYVDITSESSLRRGFGYLREKYGPRISSVIHLASYCNFIDNDYKKYEMATVKGTEDLLKALQPFTVEQFIFTSTHQVFAPCGINERINEQSPKHPKWSYPKSKLQAENFLLQHHNQIPLAILYLGNCYDENGNFLPLEQQIHRISKHTISSRFFPGNIHYGSPYLHLEDLAQAILKLVLMRRQLPTETMFLIGEGKTMSYDQFQRTISKLIHGEEINTHQLPKWFVKCLVWIRDKMPFMGSSDIKTWLVDAASTHHALDISKANEMLAWHPNHFIGDTLPSIIKRNPHH